MTLSPEQKVEQMKQKNARFEPAQEYLPGLGAPTEEMGSLEAATRRTVRHMQDIGLVTQAEEAYCVLAIEAAREWDKGAQYGKLSGKAMYLNAVNSVFHELPKLEKAVAKEGKTIDDLIESIMEKPNEPSLLS